MLEALIPGLLIAVVTLLGSQAGEWLATNRANKRKDWMAAYENLYIPFITLMYKSNAWILPFSKMPEDLQGEFFRLLMKNIRYMNRDNLYKFWIFHGHFGSVLVGNLTGKYGIITSKRLSEVFSDLVESILNGAVKLAQKLKLPDLATDCLELYDQDKKLREDMLDQ